MIRREKEESLRALAMLRYQAGRYRAEGNGAKIQQVLVRIRQLMNEMNADAVN